MNFKPQCKDQADLYEQMARVLRMCKEAGFDRPWECVKFRGAVCLNHRVTAFDLQWSPEDYEFFRCFIEGRPVFRGDALYNSYGDKFIIDAHMNLAAFTWNPPQRTIEINGVKVKAPLSVEGSDDAEHPERHGVFITFKDYEDAEAFKAALEEKK